VVRPLEPLGRCEESRWGTYGIRSVGDHASLVMRRLVRFFGCC
jgi:hypothetical protein